MPPHDEDAERARLGSGLLLMERPGDPAWHVEPGDYYLLRHQAIAAATDAVHEAGLQADVVTVGSALGDKLDECGGHAYLLELLQCVPHAHHGPSYAAIVRAKADERRALAALADAQERLRRDRDADPAEVLSRVAEAAEAIRSRRSTRGPCLTAADILRGYDPRTEPPDTLYRLGDGALGTIEVGPGLVTVFAAGPAAGKTALVGQGATDAARLDPGLRVLIVNVEMSPRALLDRQLARLSGVDLSAIRGRNLTQQQCERVGFGLEALGEVADRIAFAAPPYSLDGIDAAIRRHRPGLLVLDYAQRIAPRGDHASTRERINAVMEAARRYADDGMGVIVVSAVSRQKGKGGDSSYSGLNMASLRESSEIEYGADSIYLMEASRDDPSLIVCRHAKARHGQPTDLTLTFDGAHQSFTAAERMTADDWFGEAA